jgi:hypothetical protein
MFRNFAPLDDHRGAKRSIDDNAASPSLSQTAQCDRTPKQKGDFIHFNPLFASSALFST